MREPMLYQFAVSIVDHGADARAFRLRSEERRVVVTNEAQQAISNGRQLAYEIKAALFEVSSDRAILSKTVVRDVHGGSSPRGKRGQPFRAV